MLYGPSEVAKLLQTSVTTIHRWSDQFSEHLSPQARRPEAGQRRQYTESDVAVLRRAQHMLKAGVRWNDVNSQLYVWKPGEAEPEPDEPARDEAPRAAPDEAQERAQNTAGQALLILDQQTRLIDAQAGQLADQRAQIADQAARLREQAAQIAGQAGDIAALRERLARVEEAQKQAERRRFRWPWEPRDEAPS